MTQTREEKPGETGTVVIFDTAAGRLIGKVIGVMDGESVTMRDPRVLDVMYHDDTAKPHLTFGRIAYAMDTYVLAPGGIRGHAPAKGQFLEEYEKHLEEATGKELRDAAEGL